MDEYLSVRKRRMSVGDEAGGVIDMHMGDEHRVDVAGSDADRRECRGQTPRVRLTGPARIDQHQPLAVIDEPHREAETELPFGLRANRAANAASISDAGAPVKMSNGASMNPSDKAVTLIAPIVRDATAGNALC
jgi:hypothetical protein